MEVKGKGFAYLNDKSEAQPELHCKWEMMVKPIIIIIMIIIA